jgi:hypothetical protein
VILVDPSFSVLESPHPFIFTFDDCSTEKERHTNKTLTLARFGVVQYRGRLKNKQHEQNYDQRFEQFDRAYSTGLTVTPTRQSTQKKKKKSLKN